MREVLYAKYNSTRSAAFQTKVQIVKEEGKTFVETYPLSDKAYKHVNNILVSYENYKDLYNNVTLVPLYMKDNVIYKDFISGKSVLEMVSGNIYDIDKTVEEIKYYLNIIFDYNPKYLMDFKVTDEFLQLFGRVNGIENYSGKAVCVSDFDAGFDNYICDSGKIYSIDYEWIIKLLVPIDFLKYRAVKMFYLEHVKTYTAILSLDSFIEKIGFDPEHIRLFENMDEGFQQYVHEDGRRAIYTDKYIKPFIKPFDFQKKLEIAEKQNRKLKAVAEERQQKVSALNGKLSEMQLVVDDLTETVQVLRRERRNPFYALYRLLRKIGYKILPHKLIRILQILKNEGLRECVYKVRKKITETSNYEKWITDLENQQENKRQDITFKYNPLISVVIPTYNVAGPLLTECLESVINQRYENWQLCIADDCSTMPDVKKVLKKYENNPKIDIVYRDKNGHISNATNSAISVAKGEFIALLDCDDVITPDALYEMVYALNENPEYDLLYSDEDKIDEDGKNRNMPHFKPDWSPDTLMSNMYICHFSLYRKSILDEIGGLRVGYEGSQDYDLALRFTEKIPASHIKHIPKILYHWRTRKESTATDINAKPYILEAAYKAKADSLERRGINGKLELIKDIWQYRVNYIPSGKNKVSIIIPSKDNPTLLEKCIKSIVEKTKYKKYEIIVVDNGSCMDNKLMYIHLCETNHCKYMYQTMDFNFSKMCNIGASISTGEYLLFLNDDIEVIDGEWLERMLGQAELPYSGAVGAKLLYPDSNRIQHVGVINIANGPSHAFEGMDDSDIYYFGRNKLEYNFLAVTAACLLVDAQKFKEVGGFDEELLVAYNDVDFCFRLVEAGYYNVVRNDAILYHYESYSRGNDVIDERKMRRLALERDRLYAKHPKFAPGLNMDPFYSRYLSQSSADFSYNYLNTYME